MSPTLWGRHIGLLWFAISRHRRRHWCCLRRRRRCRRRRRRRRLCGQDSRKTISPRIIKLTHIGH